MQGSVAVDIVHEATHGWLFNVARLDASEDRVKLHEKICCREEARFFKRWLLANGHERTEAQSKADSMLKTLLSEIEGSVVRRHGRAFVLRRD